MDLRALHRTIARGISEEGIEDQFADLVGNAKGWEPGTRKRRVRLMQWLSEHNDRNADLCVALLAQHAFAYHDRLDLCDEIVGALMRAQWEGERAREESPPRPGLRTVPPRGRARGVA